jgi:hypothetical protein
LPTTPPRIDGIFFLFLADHRLGSQAWTTGLDHRLGDGKSGGNAGGFREQLSRTDTVQTDTIE